MNKLDRQYQELLQELIDKGVPKSDRTGTGTLSLFGKQIRHKMSDGFPLLTTKKMYWQGIMTELVWFLRGDTNIKFLVDNDCHIWDGDAYKYYEKWYDEVAVHSPFGEVPRMTKETFIKAISIDKDWAERWGELGPVYGKQWRKWSHVAGEANKGGTDQIANLIRDLKTNPDSRRLMVNAWNVGELDQMVLPPCHYGFQVYTRELSLEERVQLAYKSIESTDGTSAALLWELSCQGKSESEILDALNGSSRNIPIRAISLMWNQRSVDTFLGLPFNIASYGLLLEIIAKAVNMIPDELIGNLGDVHLYSNHIEQAREQIGRRYTPEERQNLLMTTMGIDAYNSAVADLMPFGGGMSTHYDWYQIPYYTREPYDLPKLNINTEFWPTESGECGVGPLDAPAVFNGFFDDNFCKCLLEEDLQLSRYKYHPAIKAPLSN